MRGLVVGWREWVGLPQLGIEAVRAKIDTGARSSALHTGHVALFEKDGAQWTRFEVILDHGHDRGRVACTAPVASVRKVKNSFGLTEERVFITTMLRLGAGLWPIEISLADRVDMTFPVLIGRTALRRRAVVDPGRSYLCARLDASELPSLDDHPHPLPIVTREKVP